MPKTTKKLKEQHLRNGVVDILCGGRLATFMRSISDRTCTQFLIGGGTSLFENSAMLCSVSDSFASNRNTVQSRSNTNDKHQRTQSANAVQSSTEAEIASPKRANTRPNTNKIVTPIGRNITGTSNHESVCRFVTTSRGAGKRSMEPL